MTLIITRIHRKSSTPEFVLKPSWSYPEFITDSRPDLILNLSQNQGPYDKSNIYWVDKQSLPRRQLFNGTKIVWRFVENVVFQKYGGGAWHLSRQLRSRRPLWFQILYQRIRKSDNTGRYTLISGLLDWGQVTIVFWGIFPTLLLNIGKDGKIMRSTDYYTP